MNLMIKAEAGIIGPSDSVNKIYTLAQAFESKIHFKPFIYDQISETERIIEQNGHLVDFWICSGFSPYIHSKKYHSSQLFFYPRLNEGSFIRVLLEAGYKDRRNLERISFDSTFDREIFELYQDFGIPVGHVNFFHNTGNDQLGDVIDFHKKLFDSGCVDTCVTSFHSSYNQLKLLGIPTYRISPTRENIRQTIKMAYDRWEKRQYFQSQLAIMIIRISGIEKHVGHDDSTYALDRLSLQIQTTVLDFAESVLGSLVPKKLGEYWIFSTRGSIEKNMQKVVSAFDQLSIFDELQCNIGIGFGETANQAEKKAILALEHAQSYDNFTAFVVDNNGNIEGPLNSSDQIKYNFQVTDSTLIRQLKLAGVSITTYNKIISTQQNKNIHSMTSVDLSNWLNMTPRNARRILNSLVKNNLATIIGEEAPNTKGRPRKIYQISLHL